MVPVVTIPDPALVAREREALIRAAIEREHDALLRSIALMVSRVSGRMAWSAAMDMASEVLHDTTREALAHAVNFDPERSAAAWLRGIAARLLANRRRADHRARRVVSATSLGGEKWGAVLEQLCGSMESSKQCDLLDLKQAIQQLSADERRAIELRYFQHLDGDALAKALNVATAGAARVRVCRALQSLRKQFPADTREVKS